MSMLNRQLYVSCIISLHREGLLAHTTLHSIACARRFAEEQGIKVQCVITLDKHDALTERIVSSHPLIRGSDIIDIVKYGDAGASRNHAIARSSGEYIVIMDGDDYYSKNFIVAMMQQAVLCENSAIFPQYIFSFGLSHDYMEIGMADAGERMYALFADHPYCSRVAAHRKVFASLPYIVCTSGFGYEDWHWTCEAVARGIRLCVALDVVLFYRCRPGSRVREHSQAKALIPPSKFFDMLPPPTEPFSTIVPTLPAPALSRKAFIKEALLVGLYMLPKGLARGIYAKLRKSFGGSRFSGYPPAVQDALRDAATVDGMMYPGMFPAATRRVPQYDLLPGKAYAALWHELSNHHFDAVYLVGHIGVGGADLMAINYMASVKNAGKRVLCIIMESTQSDMQRIPECITVLHFGCVTSCLAHQQKQSVLVRLLLQLMPPVIHAVNEWFSFELMGMYGTALKNQSRLYASIFADSQDEQDIHFGAGTQYLRSLMGSCSKIITDNMVTAKEWHARLGLPLDLFQAVYGVAQAPRSVPQSGGSQRVLWAGRLDREKRLDILLAIARLLPSVSFDVYGQAVLDRDGGVISDLERQPNVTLRGGYKDFYELPVQQYAAFLYTTQNEGLPNVLLEAAACGLSLIAPDRGGISDFVTNETGWLIASYVDVEAYVAAIRAVLGDPAEAEKRAQRAQQLLISRHSPENFAATLLRVYNFPPHA